MAKNPLVLDEDLGKSSTKGTSNESVLSVDTAEIEKKVKEKIPNDYIPIRLETNGRLDAPKVLHFRDYTMDDALELNVLEEDDRLKALIAVLNNMVYEDFDCANLHIKELMQIVYTLHGTFLTSKVTKEFYLNLDLPEGNGEGQKSHPSNIDKVEVDLTKLKLQNLDEDSKGHIREKKFKEPFTLVDLVKKTKMKFRLSRIGDLIYAQEHCNTLYADELKRFRPLKKAITKLMDIEDLEERRLRLDEMIDANPDEYAEYQQFLQKHDNTYIKLIQAQQLVELDGVELKTIEDKLKVYSQSISETVWPTFNAVVEEYNFGVLDTYSFYCDKLQKNITRRFPFQLLDFLPDIEQDYSKRYTLQFD